MKTIPIILSKTGFDLLIEQLRTDLENSSYSPKTFPAVKKGIRETKTFPECYMNDGTIESIAIIPDNSENYFIFFEKGNANFDEYNGLNNYDFSLIAWFNLKSLDENKTYDFSEEIIKEIIDILNGFNSTNIVCQYNYNFQDYSLINQKKMQFLTYPYNSVKINCRIGASC